MKDEILKLDKKKYIVLSSIIKFLFFANWVVLQTHKFQLK